MHRTAFLLALACAVPARALQTQAPAVRQPAPRVEPQGAESGTQTPASDGKTRIYVSDSQSWEVNGGWGVSHGSAGGYERGGARPQTAEIIKTFNQRCPEYIVTNKKNRANYAVILDHEGGKGVLRRRNKIVVFNREGDAIFSNSTIELGSSVKDACAAVTKDMAHQK